MAKIRCKFAPFNGSIGPVRFTDGEAETDVTAMVAHFKRDPDRYEVTEPKGRQRRQRGKAADEQPEQPDKADDQAAEGEPDTEGTDTKE